MIVIETLIFFVLIPALIAGVGILTRRVIVGHNNTKGDQ